MPAVVAISDLHLGEDASVANPLLKQAVPYFLRNRPFFDNPPVNTTPGEINALLRNIARESGGISDLVLLGDIIDLSQASYSDCALQAREFFRQILDGILPRALVWVPGNHDHHLWVQVFEDHYIEEPLRRGELPLDFPRVTGPGIRTGALHGSTCAVRFLLGLFPRHVRDRFWLAYPNYVTTCGDVNLLFHHGHFFDGTQSWIGTTLVEAQNLAELEMFNSAYIDFIWYGSGQAGRLSEQIESFYEEMRWLAEKLKTALDIVTLQGLFRKLLGRVKKGGDRNETMNRALAGRIERYLKYIEKEREAGAGYPSDYNLVFGHTHRPLKTELNGRPVYNTGGWSADELWPGENNLTSALFVARSGGEFEVKRVDIDREVYDFCHRLNHAIRKEIKIDPGAPSKK